MNAATPLDSIRAIAFDFDGTLVESNPIKREAYYEVFASVAGSTAVLERVLRENPEADRHHVVRETRAALAHAGLDGLPSTEELTRAYGHLCEDGVATCPAVPGALEALEALRPHYPLYLASATPEAALRRAVERRGWSGFFRGVLGGPARKAENLLEIATREGIVPSGLLLVGDGPPDRRAAMEFGCRFAGFDDAAQHLALHERLAVLAPLTRLLCARSPEWGAPRPGKSSRAG